jgi:hypothetical protein
LNTLCGAIRKRHPDSSGKIADVCRRGEEEGVVQRVVEGLVCGVQFGRGGVAAIGEAEERRVCANCGSEVVEGGETMETILVGYPVVDGDEGGREWETLVGRERKGRRGKGAII